MPEPTPAAAPNQSPAPVKGTHEYREDPRNRDVLIYVNGEHAPRDQAKVSVFDSGFVLGDGVWEGLRVHRGRYAFLDAHLDRLYEGAMALDLDIGMSREALTAALYETLRVNGMTRAVDSLSDQESEAEPAGAPQVDAGADAEADSHPTSDQDADKVHVRLMVTRGLKATPYQDPRVTIGPATIVIIPEYKAPDPAVLTRGIRLFTVHVRRGPADVQDPKLNSHSKLNCILACIQAAKAGADEALMLDPHGFVATCNSTHFFIVRHGEVWTSSGDYCLGGITRGNVIALCREHAIPVRERNFSLTDVYGAEESFVTGTFAGVAPVVSVDGRTIGTGTRGPITERLQSLYLRLMDRECSA